MHWMRHERPSSPEAVGEKEDCSTCVVFYYSLDGGSTVRVASGLRPAECDLPMAEVFAVNLAGRRVLNLGPPPS